MSSRNSPRLSVAILARNCAPQVRETIATARLIADEIVVLDTGSTDDTIVAAIQAGAIVHRRPWDDDFAAARNACFEKLSGEWVLWLDAGETLATDQSQLLGEFLQSNAAKGAKTGYLLTIALPTAQGQIGGEQIARLRLHPRADGLQFVGRVRERLDESLEKLGFSIESLPVVIERSVRDHDLQVKAAKAQRNIRLADRQLAERGPSADLHNLLGDSFQGLGDAVRGAQHYHRALEAATKGSREKLEAYYGLLTCMVGAQPERSMQLALCMEALERFPLDAQLLVALGGYLQALEQLELARRAYDVAFRHGQIELQIWHLPEIREIAAVCAANTLKRLGSHNDARTLLEAAVRVFPHSSRLGRMLTECQSPAIVFGTPRRVDSAEMPASHLAGNMPVIEDAHSAAER